MSTLVMDRVETDVWLGTYGSDDEIRRRRNQLPGKLKKLGVLDEPKDVALLDVCCGHGEALDVFHENGFRALTGIDLTKDERLHADKRFTTVQGDATSLPFPDASFDVVTCIHAMHHFATPENVKKFVHDASRVLKPGGRLYILDFENSPQILTAFWFFRVNPFWFGNAYLKNFARLVIEEWPFLQHYLPRFSEVRNTLYNGPFRKDRLSHSLFYSFWRLVKR